MEPVVYLASFKGTHAGLKGLFNRFTRWATKGIYSHTETCIGNPLEGEVMCVSALGTGVRGVVMRLKPEEFDVVPMYGVKAADVLAFLEKNKGAPYDVIGCIRSVLPFVSEEHPTNWFCTETSAAIAGLKDGWRYQPSTWHSVWSGLMTSQPKQPK